MDLLEVGEPLGVEWTIMGTFCGGRRARGGRPDLVGRQGEMRATDRTLISSILRNLPYDGE